MDDFKTAWLCALLDCEEQDLLVLEKCEYDIDKIIEKCRNVYESVSINALIRTIIDIGLDEMSESLCKREARLKEKQKINKETMDEKQQEELEAIDCLYPTEEIWAECDGAKTQVWFQQSMEEYQKYAEAEIERFETDTGFHIMT